MGADQIAQLVPAIRQVLDGPAEGRSLCATFEVSGDADKWVQFTGGALNFAYPLDADPALLPARLGIGLTNALVLIEWEARAFATFNLEAQLSVRELARIIDAIFESTLGCAGKDYGLDVEIIDLPPD